MLTQTISWDREEQEFSVPEAPHLASPPREKRERWIGGREQKRPDLGLWGLNSAGHTCNVLDVGCRIND